MSDSPTGPDWERAQDGKWYAPGTLSAAGWWLASDGVWYPPAPVAPPPQPQPQANKQRLSAGAIIAVVAGVLFLGVIGLLAVAADDGSEVEDVQALAAELEAAGVPCSDLRIVEDAVIPGPAQATSTAECQDSEVMLNVFASTNDQEATVDASISNPCGSSDTPFFVLVAADNWIAQPLSGLRSDAAPIAEAMDAEVFAAC